MNQEQNTKVNEDIEEIYNKLPKHLRVLPHDDMQFFSKKKEYRKQQRLKDKIRWVNKVKRIINKIITTNPSAALMHNWLLGIT